MSELHKVTVFVSSVFRDMHLERDLLNRHVFPELQERLRARGLDCEVQWIDLRWGLDTSETPEDEREMQILQVCLEEIERSPFFLCLLGQAYGTQPSQSALGAIADEFGLHLPPHVGSVTDIEIEFASSLAAGQSLSPLFLFRDPEPAGGEEPLMSALKARVLDQFPDQVTRYQASDLTHPSERWASTMIDLLVDWCLVRLPTPDASTEFDPAADHRRAFDRLRHGVSEVFVGRREILDQAEQLLVAAAGGDHKICLLTAGAGAGKTALAVRLVERLLGGDSLVLFHFTGLQADGRSTDAMLRRFCDQLSDVLERARATDAAQESGVLQQLFAGLLAEVAARRRVLVVIDTLEELGPALSDRLLTWWPREVEGAAGLLATCRDPAPVKAAWELPNALILRVPAFQTEEAIELVGEICARYRRRLPRTALTQILAKAAPNGAPAHANPLWVTLLVEELNLLGSSDFNRAGEFEERGGEAIERLLLEVVDAAPSDVAGLYQYVFQRMEASLGRRWVATFVSLLASARSGFRPSDILAIFTAVSRLDSGEGLTISPLRLSQLRHRLRAQVNTSGLDGAWRLNHATALEAGRNRYLQDSSFEAGLHGVVSDHLVSLRAADPFRFNETPHHLWQAGKLTDLVRHAVRRTDWPSAETFLELLSPKSKKRIPAASLVADRNLSSQEAHRLAAFISRVSYFADRSWQVSEVTALLEDLAEGLELRRDTDGPGLNDTLTFVENEVFQRLARVGRHAEAAAFAQRAIERAEQLVRDRPNSIDYLNSLAHTLERAGHAAFGTGKFDLAFELLGKCLETRRRLLAYDPVPANRIGLSSALAWLGAAHMAAEAFDRAKTQFEEALQEYRGYQAAIEHDPEQATPGATGTGAMILEHLVDLRARERDIKGAGLVGDELIALRKIEWEEDPGDMTRLRTLCSARLWLSGALSTVQDPRAEALLEDAVDGLAQVLTIVPDDTMAAVNFCSAAGSLDIFRMRRLRLTPSPPHAALVPRAVGAVGRGWQAGYARLEAMIRQYGDLAGEFSDDRLLTAAQLCIRRYVWWRALARGDGENPSPGAVEAILKEIEPVCVAAMRLRTQLREHEKKYGSSKDAPPPPALISPIELAAEEADETPLNSTDDAMAETVLAVSESIISWNRGVPLNADRWLERAEIRVRRLTLAGVVIPPNLAGAMAQGRQLIEQSKERPPNAYREPSASEPADPMSDETPAIAVERFSKTRLDLTKADPKPDKDEFLRLFDVHVSQAGRRLGGLLRHPKVAVEQIFMCLWFSLEAQKRGLPFEARRSGELGVDVALAAEADTDEAEETPDNGAEAPDSFLPLAGSLAIGQLLDQAQPSTRQIAEDQLRRMMTFATEATKRQRFGWHPLLSAARSKNALALRLMERDAGSLDEALTLMRDAADMYRQAFAMSGEKDIALDFASQTNRVGELHLKREEPKLAEACFANALKLRRNLAREFADDRAFVEKVDYYIAGSLTRMATLAEDQGDEKEAADLFGEAASIRHRLHAAEGADLSQTAPLLWWASSRAADLNLSIGRFDEASRWSFTANDAVAAVIQHTPEELPKMLTSINVILRAAEDRADVEDHAGWKAWMLRLKGFLQALESAGAPSAKFETLKHRISWSDALNDPPPAPMTAPLERALALAADGNFDGARSALEDPSLRRNDRDMAREIVGIMELEAAGRPDEAALRMRWSVEQLVKDPDHDPRLMLIVGARSFAQTFEADRQKATMPMLANLRSIARILYGSGDPRVEAIGKLATGPLGAGFDHLRTPREDGDALH